VCVRACVGQINDGTGFARFVIRFKAIVCRLFRNEVVDAIVTDVNSVRERLFVLLCRFN